MLRARGARALVRLQTAFEIYKQARICSWYTKYYFIIDLIIYSVNYLTIRWYHISTNQPLGSEGDPPTFLLPLLALAEY